MAPPLLIAIGAVVYVRGHSAPLPCKLVAGAIAASGIFLALMGNGPFQQYHVSLLLILTALAACAISAILGASRTPAPVVFTGDSPAGRYIAVGCSP